MSGMTLIRPATRVFTGDLPLLLVVGAYAPPGCPDTRRMADLLSMARGYRWPIAYWRRVPSEPMQCTWRLGTRPRVTDRVFEGSEPTPFANREFRAALLKVSPTEIFVLAPPSDSDGARVLADATRVGCKPTLVTGRRVLQNCSGGASPEVSSMGGDVQHESFASQSVDCWKESLRVEQ